MISIYEIHMTLYNVLPILQVGLRTEIEASQNTGDQRVSRRRDFALGAVALDADGVHFTTAVLVPDNANTTQLDHGVVADGPIDCVPYDALRFLCDLAFYCSTE